MHRQMMTWNGPSFHFAFPPHPGKKGDSETRTREQLINMHGEGNADREVKKLGRKGKVDNKGSYQSSYHPEKIELKPPGETLVPSSYLRDEEAVVFM